MIIPTGAGVPYMAFMRADCKYPFGRDKLLLARQIIHIKNVIKICRRQTPDLARRRRGVPAYVEASPRN